MEIERSSAGLEERRAMRMRLIQLLAEYSPMEDGSEQEVTRRDLHVTRQYDPRGCAAAPFRGRR